MNKTFQKLLKEPWHYSMSRNVPLWQSELLISKGHRGFTDYDLPIFISVKVNRGTHSDFYFLNRGQGNVNSFKDKLRKNYQNKSYIDFLEKKYLKNGNHLIKLARQLKPDYKSVEKFIHYYGRYACMLDLTAISSKVVTNELIKFFKNQKNFSELLTYYARPTIKPPICRLESALDNLYGKKINIKREAKKLHKKFCWIPVSFLNQPWDVKYFINRIKKAPAA